MGRRNRFLQRLQALPLLAFGRLTRLLPLPVSRTLAVLLGRIAYHVIPRIRKVGLANLDLAYGDTLSRKEKFRILRGAVRNLALVAAEFPRMPSLARRRYEGYVTIKGEEHLPAKGGVLFIGGHLGNWEWMASVWASHGHPMAEVVRPFDEPTLSTAIDGIRRTGMIHTIPKDNAAAEVLSVIKEGWSVGILIDQSPRQNGVPVTFFGEPCWATIAPVMMAVRGKVPVHPVSMFRDARGRYTLQFYPALEMTRTGNLRQDIMENTQRCQTFLEHLVRAHPEQWLWLHRRWKHRERLQREWEAKVMREVRG